MYIIVQRLELQKSYSYHIICGDEGVAKEFTTYRAADHFIEDNLSGADCRIVNW